MNLERFSVVRNFDGEEFPVWTFNSNEAASEFIEYLMNHEQSSTRGELSIKEWKTHETFITFYDKDYKYGI